MGPGRREIGHGALAERSLLGILPSPEEFPYTVRVVSDITESNGSSSMASICGGCLAMMDAGVPIKNTCAGISVGRFTDENGENEVYVTDILGEEDFFGDMDFKVAGTREGITGIQLDLKARGLSLKQIEGVFEQAKEGRFQLIDAMETVIAAPREEISKYAPRMETIKIHPEKIGRSSAPAGRSSAGFRRSTASPSTSRTTARSTSAPPTRRRWTTPAPRSRRSPWRSRSARSSPARSSRPRTSARSSSSRPGTDGMCHISELADGYVESVG